MTADNLKKRSDKVHSNSQFSRNKVDTSVWEMEVNLKVIKLAFELLFVTGIAIMMIFSMRNLGNVKSTNNTLQNKPMIIKGNDNSYKIVGGTCYKYRWGDYDVGSANVYFGGNVISSKCSSNQYVIDSSSASCFVCSFNETGNSNYYATTEVAVNITYRNSEMLVVFGQVTLTTSIAFVPVQTSDVEIVSNVNAEPGIGGSGRIKVSGQIDYNQMATGYLSWSLTFLGFL